MLLEIFIEIGQSLYMEEHTKIQTHYVSRHLYFWPNNETIYD